MCLLILWMLKYFLPVEDIGRTRFYKFEPSRFFAAKAIYYEI
uniref:Uncharacterized protein n=1 Tax=Arundo donax TaxID=35708 RepID=A0A0A9F6S2_ARUDO